MIGPLALASNDVHSSGARRSRWLNRHNDEWLLGGAERPSAMSCRNPRGSSKSCLLDTAERMATGTPLSVTTIRIIDARRLEAVQKALLEFADTDLCEVTLGSPDDDDHGTSVRP